MITRIKVRTIDKITLKGFLFQNEKENNVLNIFIPGFEGNIVSNDFVDYIIKDSLKNNMDFLYVHTRGSFQISNSVKIDNTERNKIVGTAFETIEESVYDLDSWFNYIQTLNYRKVNIISHSFGSIKLIYYFNKTNHKYSFNKIIFLSPMDYIGKTKKRKKYNSIREEALHNIEDGNPNHLLKCGFYFQSSETFIKLMDNPDVDCWPILDSNIGNLSFLKAIPIPVTIIYGGEETEFVEKIDDYKQLIPNNYKFKILENANHSYEHNEEKLSNLIMEILKNE